MHLWIMQLQPEYETVIQEIKEEWFLAENCSPHEAGRGKLPITYRKGVVFNKIRKKI